METFLAAKSERNAFAPSKQILTPHQQRISNGTDQT